LTGYDRERVETLLRERSAGMTRTPPVPPLHPDFPASGVPLQLEPLAETVPASERKPLLEVSLEGVCADCGDRISAARLKALPEAERCVACQRELEARER
jgi:Prokaryotic dksA/traR C4-type zinc finger